MRGLYCSNCGRPLHKPFTVTVLGNSGSTETYKNKVPSGVTDGEGAVVVYRHDVCSKKRKYGKFGNRIFDKPAGNLVSPMSDELVEYSEDGIRVKAKNGRILMVMPNLM